MVTREEILDILRGIDDPEMPISIVDLGIVDKVDIEGENRADVRIDLLPTFVGCPALTVIEDEVRRRIGQLAGVNRVQVQFHFDPPWTVDRVSGEGRERMRQLGITVPRHVDQETVHDAEPRCPFCGSNSVRRENAFGPTRCRMIYYCETCRNPFEHLKRLALSVV